MYYLREMTSFERALGIAEEWYARDASQQSENRLAWVISAAIQEGEEHGRDVERARIAKRLEAFVNGS